MTNKHKQELANWLRDNVTSTIGKYNTDVIRKLNEYASAPNYLRISKGIAISKAGIQKFINKYADKVCTNREEVLEGIGKEVNKLLKNISTVNSYTLCIDISGSTGKISKEIQDGVNQFKNNLFKTDKNAYLTIIEFGSKNDVKIIDEHIPVINISKYIHKHPGCTALNDGIILALNTCNKYKNEQHTIVVFTDGEENDSIHNFTVTKLAISRYNISIVFIGTGKRYAKQLGIPNGNILEFQATQQGTINAYNELTQASVERIEKVKAGKDVSKDAYFKTKTELATMLKKSANIDMTVCYEKKMTPEQKKSNSEQAENYITNLVSNLGSGKYGIKTDDINYSKLFDIFNKVEQRILTGKHDGTINEFGRYKFIEYNSKTPKNPIREVNPDTILWIEIKGQRYNKK